MYSALYRRIKQATKKMVRPQYNLDVMQSDYSGGNITSVSYSSGGGHLNSTWNLEHRCQCDQIGRFFNFFGTNFIKSSRNVW